MIFLKKVPITFSGSHHPPCPELTLSADPGKVVMLNLLKFKPAEGASYMEYARRVAPILDGIGAKLIFAGPVTTVIGHESWDAILLVEYPSQNICRDGI